MSTENDAGREARGDIMVDCQFTRWRRCPLPGGELWSGEFVSAPEPSRWRRWLAGLRFRFQWRHIPPPPMFWETWADRPTEELKAAFDELGRQRIERRRASREIFARLGLPDPYNPQATTPTPPDQRSS